MNILEIEDLIKGLPDQALMQEAQRPSGRMPQYLVVSEIQRRGDMRKRFQAQQQEKGTVAEQILQGGIAEVAPPPPQMQAAMGQQPGMSPQGMPPAAPMGAPPGMMQPPMPQGIPGPQAAQMAAQAPVRMAEGRQAPSIYDLDRDPFLVNMGLIQPPGVPLTDREIGLMATEDLMQAARDGRISEEAARQEYQARVGRSPLERLDELGGKLEDRALQFLSMPANLTGDIASRVGEFAFETGPRDVGNVIRYLTTPTRESDFELPKSIADVQQGAPAVDQTVGLDALAAQLRGMDGPMPGAVSDPSQSSAVRVDASKVVTGGSEAGDVPGARTEVDPATMDAALQSGDPDAKVRQDAGAPRLGGDPTGSYNLGDVSGIGSVGAAQTLLNQTPAAAPEFTEEGDLASIGNPLAEYQAKRIREAELPSRSYQELINKVMERSGRDYSEGAAAAAAIRAESETEQQRLKEEGRSAALSDALIALGAGIAGGDLAGGLSRAGQAATAARKEFDTAARQERRYGTLEARAEERAAMAARSAAEAQQLGLMGRQVEADYEANLAKINRDLEADKVLASAAERMGADRRAAEQFLVTTRAKAESLMAQLAQMDQEDRKQAQLSARAISDFLEEVATADLPAGLQMSSPEEQTRYRRQLIRQYIPDLEAVFGRKIEVPPIGGAPVAAGGGVNAELERALGSPIGER